MLWRTTLEQLDKRVEELYELFGSAKCKVLTETVADSPALLERDDIEFNDFRLKGSLKLDEKVLLGVLSWYVPEELKLLLQFELERIWGGEKREWLAVLTQSKLTALGLLLVRDDWNDNDFYGNVLTEKVLKNIFNSFPRSLIRRKPKARRVTRRRGYRDKGFRRPSHEAEPSFTRRLKSIEEIELEEVLYRQKVIDLQEIIELRLQLETQNSFLDSISF